MNYGRVYEALIEKRRKEPLNRDAVYCERHHFIPRCMGGGNEVWNLVYLTAKEHFVAHHLLYKINPTDQRLLAAFIAMCAPRRNGKRYLLLSARRHGKLREEYAAARRAAFAAMTDEEKQRRIAHIKEGCAKRSVEKTRLKVERWRKSYMGRSEDAKLESLKKRKSTEAARSPERRREIFDRISRSHRKSTEDVELRIVAEYQSGKTAKEIAQLPWCQLGREGVNYLLRRRGVVNHQDARWAGEEESICADYKTRKYPTRGALAKAYGASWSAIKRILEKNGVRVVAKNPKLAYARCERGSQRLRELYVSFCAPFSKTKIESMSFYDAIERLRMFGLAPRTETRRVILRKIRAALGKRTKFAYGYAWIHGISTPMGPDPVERHRR